MAKATKRRISDSVAQTSPVLRAGFGLGLAGIKQAGSGLSYFLPGPGRARIKQVGAG